MVRYLSNSDDEIRAMLEAIGVRSVDELFTPIPSSIRLTDPLDLPPAKSEQTIYRDFFQRSLKNRIPPEIKLFLGAGCYHHYIPSVVWDVISKPEFATAYTPYQPEISQGTLQSIFEFQTLICQLTGMDVANASMYDGASAFAEAVLMAHRIHRGKRNHALISQSIHPEYRQVLTTYTRHLGLDIEEIPFNPETGQTDLDYLREHLRDDTFAVAVQSPNVFGIVEDWSEVASAVGSHPALKIATFTEALSLALLKPPGEADFDIVAGEGQSFGLPMNFGGPHLGLFATKMDYVRRMPGRLVGVAHDTEGHRGFVMTLVAREQHIRREKATSNICTNQALCALAATVYLSLMGPVGLRKLAEINVQRAHALARSLTTGDYTLSFRGPFFNEFVLEGPDLLEKRERLLKNGYVLGLPLSRWYPALNRHLLITVTEMNDPEDLNSLAKAFLAD